MWSIVGIGVTRAFQRRQRAPWLFYSSRCPCLADSGRDGGTSFSWRPPPSSFLLLLFSHSSSTVLAAGGGGLGKKARVRWSGGRGFIGRQLGFWVRFGASQRHGRRGSPVAARCTLGATWRASRGQGSRVPGARAKAVKGGARGWPTAGGSQQVVMRAEQAASLHRVEKQSGVASARERSTGRKGKLRAGPGCQQRRCWVRLTGGDHLSVAAGRRAVQERR